jgi:hypothetical protein
VIDQPRPTQRRVLKPQDDEESLTRDIIKLAVRYGRYGYRRITALLRDLGWRVNHKRVERIWRREGLKVPKKQPKRGRLWLNDGSKLAGKARIDKRFYRCNNVDRLVGSRVCNSGSYFSADQVGEVVWDAVADALKNPEHLAAQYRDQLSDSSALAEFERSKKQIALTLKRVGVQEDRMTDAYRNEAIELDRFKADMQKLSQRRKGLERQRDEMRLRKVQEESRQDALEHLERLCTEVTSGICALTFEERHQLLRLVIERVVVKDDSVIVEMVIPSDGQRAGLLGTRHPCDVPRELDVAIGKFVDFYNYRRYRKALKDITPADMLAGQREEILGRRRGLRRGRSIDVNYRTKPSGSSSDQPDLSITETVPFC